MKQFWMIFIDQFRFVSDFGATKGQPNPGAIWMWVLLALFVVGAYIALEKFMSLWLKYGSISSEKFMTEVNKYVENGDLDKAHVLAKKFKRNALPYVIMSGLEAAKSIQQPDFRTIQNGIDTSVMEIMPKLQARISYINLIASVATLIGLAGTIFGLILAFDAVGQPGIPEAQKSQMLAAGISAAMGTTIAGLFIAVPMNIIYTIILNKITRIIDDIDEWGVKFINLTQRMK